MSFFNEIANMFGLSEAALSLGYNYVNYNGEAVYAEGIKGVLKISESLIVLRLGKGVLYVYGNGLNLTDTYSGCALIRGEITAVTTSALKDGQL